MKFEQAIVGIGLLSMMGMPMTVEASDSKSITLKQIGRYSAGIGTTTRAEIAAYDPGSKRLFSVNLELKQLDIVDLSNAELPVLTQTVPLGGNPNSVAVHDGIVAVAVEGPQKTDPGNVKFFNTSGALLNQLTVGALPDMLVFSPNGKWLLVANEGEPSSYNNNPVPSVDPEGSVSIIEMRRDVTSLTQLNVRTATFSPSIPQENSSSIRIYGPNATFAQDIEPEYITVSHDSKTAWVTLQENNAIGILNIPTATFTKIVGLGFKDHLLAENKLDSSDRDVPGSSNNGIINIRNWPVFGMYEPDAIASYRVKGETYLVMANEGDTRDYPPGFTEEARVGTLSLDAAAFAAQGYPDVTTGATGLRNNDNLGRLTVTNVNGAKELDNDADFERLYVPGGRSFSIRRANGTLVYDSGDDIEQRTAALVPTVFNSQGDAATFDSRSDNKGPEPEGVAIGKVSGRTYAFIGLERTGGVMVYDISKPTAPKFATYINTAPTDLSPEGIFFIKKKDSPNGKPLLVVSHEVSNTVAIFEIVTDSREEDGDDDEVVLEYTFEGTVTGVGLPVFGLNPAIGSPVIGRFSYDSSVPLDFVNTFLSHYQILAPYTFTAEISGTLIESGTPFGITVTNNFGGNVEDAISFGKQPPIVAGVQTLDGVFALEFDSRNPNTFVNLSLPKRLNLSDFDAAHYGVLTRAGNNNEIIEFSIDRLTPVSLP